MNLFNAREQFSRSQWWLGMSFAFLVGLSLVILRDGFGIVPFLHYFDADQPIADIYIAANSLLFIIGSVAAIMVTSRRLRDRGRSELWLFGLLFFPFYNYFLFSLFSLFEGYGVSMSAAGLFGSLAMILSDALPFIYNLIVVWLIIELGFLPQNETQNLTQNQIGQTVPVRAETVMA